MKKTKMTLYKKVSLIIGILLIPALYSFFYLQAYWNPYDKVDKLPIAIVNNDQGALINGHQENLGDKLVQDLRTSGSLKCSFVDSDQAQTGVEGKKYYAVITVPEDFSKDISSTSTIHKTTAVIKYEANQEHNYIASLLLKSAVKSIEENLRGSIDKEITAGLTRNLQNVPIQLSTLNNGLLKINSGAQDLQSGISQAANGQMKFNNGITSLSSGLGSLATGAASVNAGSSSLDAGLGQTLAGGQLLLKQVSPDSPLYKGATALSNGIHTLLTQFTPASPGQSATAYDELTTGVKNYSRLSNGMAFGLVYAQYLADYSAHTAGYSTIDAKSAIGLQLAALDAQTTADLRNAADQETIVGDVNLYDIYSNFYHAVLNNESIFLNPADPSLRTEEEEYFNRAMINNTNSYHTAIPAAIPVINAINAQNIAISGQKLTDGIPLAFNNLSTSVSTLYGGSQLLTAQLSSAVNGTNPTLYDGVAQLTGALGKLKLGSAQLNAGTQQVAAGAIAAKSGSDRLASGGSQLSSGLNTLKDGSAQLNTGISTAQSSVSKAVVSANSELQITTGLADYAQAPVKVQEKDLNKVPNYGTAFAPFFLSLSLWVGAIMMFFGIHFDVHARIKMLSTNTNFVVSRTIVFLLLGIGQALAMGLIIQNFLNLKITNVPMYYCSCILFSLAAVSVIQFLIIHLGDVGKLFTILLLIFQLTSCSGTFPIETVPKFYSSLNAFLPMTYSIDLLRQAIIGYHAASAHYDILVEIGITVVFTFLTILILIIQEKKARKTVDKLIESTEAEDSGNQNWPSNSKTVLSLNKLLDRKPA